MKILVPIKQILDPAGMMVNRKAGRVFINKEDYLINPASLRALEAALRVRDATGAAVSAVAFGPARAAESLCQARALGADRAILIPTETADSAIATQLLAALCGHLGGVDLVLLGSLTLDTGVSSGARLAEALGWPFMGEAVEVKVEGNIVRIVRRRGESRTRPDYEAFEADLPAVVTVTREGPAPRFAHGGNIIDVYRDPNAVETITPVDLGFSESDLQPATAERGQSFAPEREFGKQVSPDGISEIIRG